MQDSFLNFCKVNQDKLILNDIDILFIKKLISDQNNIEYAYIATISYKISKLNDSDHKNYFISEFNKLLKLNNQNSYKYYSNNEKHRIVSTHKYDLAPIVLFTYNRIDTLQLTLNSLLVNEESSESSLIIYSDGPKNKEDEKLVNNVRDYLQRIDGFKKINYNFMDNNKGLSVSIIDGLNSVSSEHEHFIVLEDDLICSPYFLNYMNASLNQFKSSKNIWTINAMSCSPEILKLAPALKSEYYFTRRASSHGWGSWSSKWNQVDWDNNKLLKKSKNLINRRMLRQAGGDIFKMMEDQNSNKIDSWAIRWVANVAMNNGLCVTPYYSHTSHQFSKFGTHIKNRARSLENDLTKSQPIYEFKKDIKLSYKINKIYNKKIYKK